MLADFASRKTQRCSKTELRLFWNVVALGQTFQFAAMPKAGIAISG
jgi:hypothetical protein